ncbi:MAG: ABC-F family ATP-binding cassette domain-containing protein [Deltaproteobacteria bacterium]|nr:ABC-F family ATP-binding cassette domain-containing protein [Deltaproteobacteria bacterium]
MPSVRLSRVCFAFSDFVPILVDVDLALQSGFTAVVGANGVGKTTLLRLIAGELRPDEGTVRVEPYGARVVTCAQEIAALEPAIASLAERDDGAAREIRARLRLDPPTIARFDTLSPGERKRWQIGAALAREPDVLLLDEPTNHLDVQARALLVEALTAFRGVGVIVSHDRGLLESLATTVVRVEGGERGRVRAYLGPWSVAEESWARERAAAVDAYEASRDQERARARALSDLRRTHVAADRQRSAGARMKNRHDSDGRGVSASFRAARAERHLGRAVAAAREKLEKVERVDKPEAELGGEVFLGWERPPQPVLAVLDADLRVGDRTLLRDVRLTLRRDDRLRVVGPNGAGKSTLLLALVAAMRVPRVGVLPQELSPKAIVEAGRAVRALPREARGRVLSLVAALGVDPRRVLSSERPSPGEARKLLLASMLGTHASVLVLDEATHHLDLPAIERLERALELYPGAIVLVTHDDTFAARCTTATLRVEDGRVR